MRVAFAGTPEFALPALAALRAHHEVVGVLTQPDRLSGRGRRLSASAVKRAALEFGLPLAQPETIAGDGARALLADWQPQVLVVVAYGLRLPRELLDFPPLGCVNIHASLLPRWRGAAPVERALLAGDATTGITIMQMDAGLDTGPVLLQRPIAISPHDTAGSLREQLAGLGAEVLLEALEGLAAGTLHATPQAAEDVTYAPRIEKAEARIDWSRDATGIERQVRAFNPWPVAETVLDGETLRVFAAHVLGGDPNEEGSSPKNRVVEPKSRDSGAIIDVPASIGVDPRRLKVPGATAPGTIVGVRGNEMIVQCGHGLLAVTEVQRPGRRALGVRDFSHGRALAGRRLG